MWRTSLFGMSDLAARLPSAVDATLLVIAVYLFFRRFRRGVEIDAALITASCAGVIGFARAAAMDMPLTASFSIGMLAWWAWRESEKKNLSGAAFYFCMALGMLAKGPVAPFLAAVYSYFWRWRSANCGSFLRTLWFPAVLIFCAAALPWYCAVQLRNPQFFREFILSTTWLAFLPISIITRSRSGITSRYWPRRCCPGLSSSSWRWPNRCAPGGRRSREGHEFHSCRKARRVRVGFSP